MDAGDRFRGPPRDRRGDPERAFEVVSYIPTGQWKTMTAYRKNLKDLVLGPVIFQWGVEKI